MWQAAGDQDSHASEPGPWTAVPPSPRRQGQPESGQPGVSRWGPWSPSRKYDRSTIPSRHKLTSRSVI